MLSHCGSTPSCRGAGRLAGRPPSGVTARLSQPWRAQGPKPLISLLVLGASQHLEPAQSGGGGAPKAQEQHRPPFPSIVRIAVHPS